MAGGQRFEQDTVSRLRGLGWEAETTAVTGDWGADVVAHAGNERLVVQCKDYGSPVGVAAVQEVAYARTHYRAQLAAVVARNGYTKAARQAASRVDVALLDIDDLRIGASLLDRSIETARRRQKAEENAHQQAQQEYEAHVALAWRRYDRGCERHRLLRWFGRLGAVEVVAGTASIAVAVLASWFDLFHHQIVAQAAAGGLCVAGLGALMVLGVNSVRPILPPYPRRSALRLCPCCEQPLRLEVARSGWLRCPRCQWFFRADT